MINEYIRYRIDSARAPDFLRAYESAAQSLRASAHCLGYELSRCREAPEHFVLCIRWDSPEGHLNGFRSSSEFQAFLRDVKPYVNDIEEMRHYEITPLHWSR